MTDVLEQSSDWLQEMRTKHATRTVSYSCGPQSLEVLATIGRTVFESVDDHGLIVKTESRDFLVLTQDLVLGGEAVLPKSGDRIREAAGSVTLVYEVMAPGGEPVWRYSDPYRKTIRIHTKLVATETTP